MRTYIPIREIERRDPEWAARVRLRDRKKTKRLREADPDAAREAGRRVYAKNAEHYRNKKKTWRDANPDKRAEIKRKNFLKRRASNILSRIKGNCKKRGIECDLTLSWLQVRLDAGVCEMSGLPFDLENTGFNLPNKPSVDRINPQGPYTQSNCRMILWSINRALCNYGEDYVLNVFRHILARREA